MRSRPGLVLRALQPGFLGCDRVGSFEERLEVATSILRSRHGWQQGRSRHGKMASRRSRNGAELS